MCEHFITRGAKSNQARWFHANTFRRMPWSHHHIYVAPDRREPYFLPIALAAIAAVLATSRKNISHVFQRLFLHYTNLWIDTATPKNHHQPTIYFYLGCSQSSVCYEGDVQVKMIKKFYIIIILDRVTCIY